MANSTITMAPASPTRSYYTKNGGTAITASDVAIASVTKSDATSILSVAFVATSTTVTINPGGEDSVAITNGTIRECCCVNGHNMATGNVIIASARRKSGTTAAILAQTVVITINAVEVGRFTVLAAGISADPVCGFLQWFSPAADTRFALVTPYDVVVTVTAADPSLEYFIEIVGKA